MSAIDGTLTDSLTDSGAGADEHGSPKDTSTMKLRAELIQDGIQTPRKEEGNKSKAEVPLAKDTQPKTKAEEILSRIISFRPFSKESYKRLVEKEKLDIARAKDRLTKAQEAHLVDGDLVFGHEDEANVPPPANPDLREGNLLMDSYGIFPKDHIGKPLEEIDKGIRGKTFVVIAKRFNKRYIYRFSATKSFFLFPPWNLVRRVALYIASHQIFDLFIIVTILVNCVFLAMPDLSFADTSEYVFLVIYGTEMIIKLIARGFFIHSYTYLRDPWNWLDFIVILSATVTLLIQLVDPNISVGNLQGLRTFRVLRALRTVSIVPGLKTIVNALLKAFKMLFEVAVLIFFFLMVFSLFALQIYMGVLRRRCVRNIENFTATQSQSYDVFYAEWIRQPSNWQTEKSGEYTLCGNVSGSGNCQANYTCLGNVGENPNYGYTGFDNMGWAMLSCFQLLTLDFWEDIYNKVILVNGPWNVVFFCFVIFFGSFYLINLMLAVVALSYEEEAQKAGKEKEKERTARLQKKINPVYNMTKLNLRMIQLSKKIRSDLEGKQKKDQDQSQKMPESDSKQDRSKPDLKKPIIPKGHKKVGSPTKKPVNPQKPLVKMQSRDSGYSTQSKGSLKLKTLTHIDSRDSLRSEIPSSNPNSSFVVSHVTFKDSSSVLEYKQKNPLVKQESQVTVSSSGIFLDRDGMSSLCSDESFMHRDRTNMIGKLEEKNDPGQRDTEKLVDRNCLCCKTSPKYYDPWLRFQNHMHIIVTDPLFETSITICIILNTVFLAIQYHGMSADLKLTQQYANYVFTSIFALEAVLKILALSKTYFLVGWNVFDLIIAVASILDIFLENVDGLSVLRTFRLLRVVKLAQSWPTMRLLLTIIINTIGALGNLTIILAIIIYIFAVIGLQLFRDKYKQFTFNGTEGQRWNFTDFFHSFMMVFRVLCGEWVEPLWECMRTSNEICMVVFLPALVLGNFIVLNLFLALLLNAFRSDSLDKYRNANKHESKVKKLIERVKAICCCCCCSFARKNTVIPTKSTLADPFIISNDVGLTTGENHKDTKEHTPEDVAQILKERAPNEKAAENGGVNILKETPDKKITTHNGVGTLKQTPDQKITTLNGVDTPKQSAAVKLPTDNSPTKSITLLDLKTAAQTAQDSDSLLGNLKNNTKGNNNLSKPENEDDLELGDTAESMKVENKLTAAPSCFPECLRKRLKWIKSFNEDPRGQSWMKFRTFILKIVDSKWFEGLVVAVILASSISLAFEDVYLYQKPALQTALYALNIVFCILFGIEMVLKLIAYGLTKYFSSFWTILDFAIVLISLASLIGDSLGDSNITAFRSLRTLRALRPLRAISRWEGMRIVVNSLMLAIPAIFNVFLVGMVFWLIFSIMGVQFFSGLFYKCVNSTTGLKFDSSVVPNKSYCLDIGQRWINAKVNFDNAGSGFLALFQVATLEGWMEIMEDAVDATQVDVQPQFENNLYAYLYFVAFIICGSFFTLNLFIGVIIDNFNVLKKKYDGSFLDALLTPSQRNYYNTLKKLTNKKPQKTIKRPKNAFQFFFYRIATNTKFELGIVILIFLNMIAMAVEHYNEAAFVGQSLNIINTAFTTVFLLEAIIKLIGLRWHYFRQAWNIFDLIIVLLSILGIVLNDILDNVYITPTLLRVVRVFRIGRVLRLIKVAKGIRKLLFALIISLPALLNIGALLFLIMYIYAIVGMSSFGDVKLAGALNEQVNFQTFGSSFVLLIRLATAAGWNDILEPLMITEPDCDPDYKTLPDGSKVASSNGDCGTQWLAVFFMVSYIVIIFLIVINMYIAVILENFNQAHQQEEVGVTEDDFDMFYSVWERYDPHATQFIKYDQLFDFIDELENPLRLPKPNEIKLVAFNLPIVEGERLHCLDVLIALVKNVLQDVEETNELKNLKRKMESKFMAVFPSRAQMKVVSTTMQKKKEEVAARALQRAWHSHKTKKALQNITAMAMQLNSIRRASASLNKVRATGIQELGRRLSSALSTFFTSSRPLSARSTTSLQSSVSSTFTGHKPFTQALSRKGNISNTLQVPSVQTLYSQDQNKSMLDLEL